MKPQDTLIALKFCSLLSKTTNVLTNNGNEGFQLSATNISYRELSSQVRISVGEISKAVKRLESVKLIIMSNNGIMVNRHNLGEWIVYGAKYAYPLVNIGFGRGMPTAWNCKSIRSDVTPPSPGLAWKSDMPNSNDIQAELVSPICPSVPYASKIDPHVYKSLALLDILRSGSPREINTAKEKLSNHIMDI